MEQNFTRDKIYKLAESLTARLNNTERNKKEYIYTEIEKILNFISETKQDVLSIGIKDITRNDISIASIELSAVLDTTAEATNTIMSACETIEDVIGARKDEQSEIIQNQITMIYEACAFQDLTGQRIQKVTKAFSQIEQKLNQLYDAIINDTPIPKTEERSEKESLLNGPQLPSSAITQDDIDKLLEDF
jgi:chemotaxis protein CheZ